MGAFCQVEGKKLKIDQLGVFPQNSLNLKKIKSRPTYPKQNFMLRQSNNYLLGP